MNKLAPSYEDELKKAAAGSALELIKDGMRLGLGTGSTARHFIDGLGAKVAAGLNVVCVATSKASHAQAESLNIPLAELDDKQKLDLTIDGADALNNERDLIKGGGGALLREKITAAASNAMLVIADESKLVDTLGAFPLPIEVATFGHRAISQNIAAVISEVQGKDAPPPEPILRLHGGNAPFVTDNGNYIYDYALQQINDPPALAAALQTIPGVVEHGLFINLATGAIIATQNGIKEIGNL
ncbi:MAG: ribose-5-phosphate isomerase RpiA [Alphaproteobacteria bacterium]|nr:ribose-5-phosphate isomerase RpiA [Alphaproteobacteria bacterium]